VKHDDLVKELVRYYTNSKTEEYKAALLRFWKEQKGREYQDAVREIER
jgi:hypothetical protein